jgi:nitrite reductase (NADH) large subunit
MNAAEPFPARQESMTELGVSAWRCDNCGYVHRGPTPPESCPVCGAPASDFHPFAEPAAPPRADSNQWRCLNCSFVHAGAHPPGRCPVCEVPADQFEPIAAAVMPGAGSDAPFKAVVVGAGIAGISAAEAIRGASPLAEITLIASEAPPPYYRLNLTRYLAGEIETDALPLHPSAWYPENRIDLLAGARTESLDLAGRRVVVSGHAVIPFDRLVLAMGAHPFIPPIQGADRDGVVTLRTTEDAERILAVALRGDPVVIIGGGVLGLETAGALARRGAGVTLLEGHEWLMPRQLDREAGGLLERHIAAMGIRLEKSAKTREISGAPRVEKIILADGRAIAARLVVMATGVRPNTHLARRAGLDVNQGIVVNNHMMTSAADVYAAGDVAEHNGVLYGTWAASQYQGSIAGMNASGLSTLYGGQPRSNTLKVLGLDLLSIGSIEPADGSFVVVTEKSENSYLRFVLHDGLLVGAILFGDTSRGAAIKTAIEGKLDFSGLLMGSPSAPDVLDRAQRGFAGTRPDGP